MIDYERTQWFGLCKRTTPPRASPNASHPPARTMPTGNVPQHFHEAVNLGLARFGGASRVTFLESGDGAQCGRCGGAFLTNFQLMSVTCHAFAYLTSSAAYVAFTMAPMPASVGKSVLCTGGPERVRRVARPECPLGHNCVNSVKCGREQYGATRRELDCVRL